jgi:Protein of unknown function (DUF2795)
LERGDRHGPRIDDELARETEPLERGSPVEPRVEEFREQEGSADDEPETDARLMGGRSAGSMDADELEARSELARSISPSVFPADRDTLLGSAIRNHATQPVLDRLARLPAGRAFENAEAVWQALGGGTERRG